MTYSLGIIGAGNMAEAIVRGVIRAKLFSPDQIIAADISPPRRELFQEQLHVKAVTEVNEVASQSTTLLLSVKPQHMRAALTGIAPVMRADALIISIAAGISSQFIESALGPANRWRVVRAMPNTPMLVGEGMVAIAPGTHATAADLAATRQLFESAASVIPVLASQMDAVTALSGSGPAYFFLLVEQMIEAGLQMGFTPEQARQLANKTAIGSARMLMESPDSAAELRRKVTSPGGTTQAAISHMEAAGLPNTIVEAIKAAQRRGQELGQ